MWHAYLTKETLSNDTKVNDLVNLTVIFILQITNFVFGATRGIRVLQTRIIFCFLVDLMSLN